MKNYQILNLANGSATTSGINKGYVDGITGGI